MFRLHEPQMCHLLYKIALYTALYSPQLHWSMECSRGERPVLFLMGSTTNLGNILLRSINLLYFYSSMQEQHMTLTFPRASTAAVWIQAWMLLYRRYISHVLSKLLAQSSHICKKKVNTKCCNRWKIAIFLDILNIDEDEWLLFTASQIVNRPLNGSRGPHC